MGGFWIAYGLFYISNSFRIKVLIECLTVSGWSEFNNMCYKHVGEKRKWVEAQDECQTLYKANLASISSEDLFTWMVKLAMNEPFWIGKAFKYTGLHISFEDRYPTLSRWS